jgi:hypothetical protein
LQHNLPIPLIERRRRYRVAYLASELMQLFQDTHPHSVNRAGQVQVQELVGAAAAGAAAALPAAAAAALPAAAAAAQGSPRLLPAAAQAPSAPPAAQLGGRRRGRSRVQEEEEQQHGPQKLRTEQQAAPMTLLFRDLSGRTMSFQVRPSTLLCDVITAYCTRTGEDSDSVRLLHGGSQLLISDTVDVAGLKDGSMLHVVLRLVGD